MDPRKHARTLLSMRAFHTSTLLQDDRVLVVGGESIAVDAWRTGRWLPAVDDAAEVITPHSGAITRTEPVISRRIGHAATLLADGRVLVSGGRRKYEEHGALRSAEIFDPATNRWTATGPMTREREHHRTVLLSDGRVLVAGGEPLPISAGPRRLSKPEHAALVARRKSLTHQPTVEVYDATRGCWTTLAPLPVDGWSFTQWGGVALQPDGCLLFLARPNSVVAFDITTGEWLERSNVPFGSLGYVLPLSDGSIAAFSNPHINSSQFATIYTPTTDAWTELTDLSGMNLSLMTSTLVETLDRLILFTGGFVGVTPLPGNFTNGAMLLDLEHRRWSLTAPMLRSRLNHTATLLRDGTVLIVGGEVSAAPPREHGKDLPATEPIPFELFDPAHELWTAPGTWWARESGWP